MKTLFNSPFDADFQNIFNFIPGLYIFNVNNSAVSLLDMNFKKYCNGLYSQFRQSFAKETLSYDEMLKS